ncbi:hypothetical protein N9Y23_10025 [Pseudomonadales bacterium]|nr:hypothetical protein [Pseudomonadales bacterium]
MKNAIIAASVAIAAVAMNVPAAELYTADGDVINVPEGSSVYISDAPVFKFTRFEPEGFDLRPLSPAVVVEEVCVDGGFTFGGSSEVCTEEVVVEEEEAEECDAFTFGGSGC